MPPREDVVPHCEELDDNCLTCDQSSSGSPMLMPVLAVLVRKRPQDFCNGGQLYFSTRFRKYKCCTN